MPNYFQERYIQNWQNIIEDLPICHVKSRLAQAILRNDRVQIVRKRELVFKDYIYQWFLMFKP